MTPFNTATNAPGSPITASKFPFAVAITPDGKTAYVGNAADITVTPISTATNAPGTPITIGARPVGIAITPDGRTAYVITGGGAVVPISTATNTVGTAIKLGGSLQQIAITPDGETAYVTSLSPAGVVPINLATNTAGTAIPVAGPPVGIAITPDGRTAYVNIDALGGTVVPVSTATNTAGAPIPVGQNPTFGIAITPDGRTVYVANRGSNTVTPINTSTNTAGTPISVGTAPEGVAVTPDGRTAYVTNLSSNTVTPIATASQTAGSAIPVGIAPAGIAITPDQAPTAAFTASVGPAGSASRFNGSASSTPVGSIASYRWSFGDGRSATTAGPVTTHVYARHGVYTVRLTVTNTAGTSTTQVFTGQTVSKQGGPQATVAHALRVGGATTLSGLSVTPSKVSIAGRLVGGECVKPTNKNKHKPHCRRPIRLVVSYTLSSAASVRFTVKRQSVAIPGSIVKAGKAGRNSFVFDGEIGGHQLAVGSYVLTATPAGGHAQTVSFQITG